MADFDLQKLASSTAEILANYIYTFTGIIISPKATFTKLICDNWKDSDKTESAKKIFIQVFIFAIVSIALGICLASFFKFKGVPDSVSPMFILSTLVIWIFIGIILHPIFRLLKAKGSIVFTIAVYVYVCSIAQIIFIPVVYVVGYFNKQTTVTLTYNYIIFAGSGGDWVFSIQIKSNL